jgi:hypothetical protein
MKYDVLCAVVSIAVHFFSCTAYLLSSLPSARENQNHKLFFRGSGQEDGQASMVRLQVLQF